MGDMVTCEGELLSVLTGCRPNKAKAYRIQSNNCSLSHLTHEPSFWQSMNALTLPLILFLPEQPSRHNQISPLLLKQLHFKFIKTLPKFPYGFPHSLYTFSSLSGIKPIQPIPGKRIELNSYA